MGFAVPTTCQTRLRAPSTPHNVAFTRGTAWISFPGYRPPPNPGLPILSNMHATAAHDRLRVKTGGLPGVSRMLFSIEVEPIRATNAIPAI